MADNNPQDGKTSVFHKKMIKDLHANFNGVDTWENARNIMVHTNQGDMFSVSNEPSNTLCYNFDSIPLSQIQLKDNRLLIIQKNGEFGVLNTIKCSYEKLFKINCPEIYNFTCKPIQGRSRLINNIEEYIVFGNEDIPIGELNLSKIPYKFDVNEDEICKTKEFTKEIDCDELFKFKKLAPPCIKVNTENNRTGNLPDGTYQAAITYLSGGDKTTEYYSLSQPIHIYNNGKPNGSIELEISNLNRSYDTFDVLLIANTTFNGNEPTAVNAENYYLAGPFNTLEERIIISDIPNRKETLDRIITEIKTPNKVGTISGNGEYLMYSDIQYSDPIDYQLQAMNIKIKYVIKQVPLEFYKTNFEFGYYGDENYAPAIRWIDNKGQKSYRYHIPGRKPTTKDYSIATGDNVYEIDKNLQLCDTPEKIQYWQVENTAQSPIFKNNKFFCNERILATGSMGYFESTNLYPDNKELFGDDSCTPIRYPKFPDECKISRYEIIDGKVYINLKLWQFENIEHPKDKNGNYRTDIIGYEILRQTRDGGNKTVKATGYVANARGYKDTIGDIIYQNYPYNDQSPDSFHSSTAVNSKNNKEKNFNPLTQVYKNKFSFYSPDANFGLKTSLGQELKILTEERANVTGYFEEVYNHPKAKLITNFSLYLASLMGLVQAYLELNGKVCTTKGPIVENITITAPPSNVTIARNGTLMEKCDSVWALGSTIKDDVTNPSFSALQKAGRTLIRPLQIALKAAGFTMLAAQHTQTWLDIIQKLAPFKQYAFQYNSVANFTESKCVNARRFVKDYQYIQETNTQLKDGIIFNNENCQKTIYIETELDVPEITFLDDSNKTITEFGICDNPNNKVSSSAAMYYAASKQPNKNQYNQLDSGNFVKTHTCIIPVTFDKNNPIYISPVVAGGDCIIVQTSFQTRRQIFSQDITNLNNSDEFTFNYKNYPNLAYPRFWYNNEQYELFNIINKSPAEGKLPSQTHNLDCRKNSKNAFVIKDEYMYTSINGVVNYIVEADANLWYREQGDRPFYSDKNQNLSQIFRSDNLKFTEEFKLNPSFFKLENNQIFSEQQPLDFDKDKAVRDKNAIIYSLPASRNQKINNWKTFLPNNFYSFDNLQFGNLVGIHPIDMDRVIFLFDKSSPYISLGISELQLSNDTITLGDGGLFARKPRELMHTDVGYGSTTSKFAFTSNQFGHFYPSANQGRLFKFSNDLDDVTRQGIHFWAKQFMPLKLKEIFSNYNEEENTICGIGYLIVFDNSYETLYVSKRDYIPLDDSIIYNNVLKQFELNGSPVSIKDKNFFKDISWTISYRPANEGFISFHDWHPDQVIQLDKHFMTVKDTGIWKHNDNCQSFCNFYGKPYPFGISPIISYGQQQNILNSFEWQLEAYHWKPNCLDKYHVLGEGFDKAQVYNSEQHSGMLNLITRTNVTNDDIYNYPKVVNNFTTDVLCIKKENKYRINGFKNVIKDRGEVSGLENYIFKNDENGYTKIINIDNFDTKKSISKFRHSYNQIDLVKNNSENTQFIFKFLNTKLTDSKR